MAEFTKDHELFDAVTDAVEDAYLIAWDECHKIYVAMDETEAAWFRENYDVVVDGTPEDMLETVVKWYNDSCGLRFVNAVRHDAENPNRGFTDLISQFAELDEDVMSY
jgi:hypothetical protein